MINAVNNKLTVYSASAGSGKTFSLTVEYVSKLLKNPKAYRSILAVTFTNKATAEMKSRILSVLWNLVYEPQKAQAEIDTIKGAKNSKLSETEVENAKQALMYILHDYDHFRIETIDSFFQRVLRNMAKEIGVGSSFEILLNDEDYVEEAVKELKEDSENDEWLKQCLDSLIKERQTEGKKWNYEKDMTEFSRELNKALVSDVVGKIGIKDLKVILSQADEAMREVREFEKQIRTFIRTLEEICNENGLNVLSYVYTAVRGDKFSITSAEKKCRIFKNKAGKEELLSGLYEKLNHYYESYYVKCKKSYLLYNSIYKLCLLVFIANRKQDLLKEDNGFLLRDTQKLLNAMVTSEDVVPFIYEKIGSRIRNIMIDEFQDTSSQAWYNFMFLLKECLASGGSCAVFGDVKQSIYRWNEGDWRILKDLYDGNAKKKYSISTTGKSLSDNYRTDAEIVNFNNDLFSQAFKRLGIDIDNQTPKRNIGKGELRFRFTNTTKETSEREGEKSNLKNSDLEMEATRAEIDYYLDNGYELDDMVILFRHKSKLQMFAEYLKECDNAGLHDHKYNPCSNEAFLLKTSEEVKKIVFILRFIADKKDTIAKYWLEKIAGIGELDKLNEYKTETVSLIDLVLRIIKDFDVNAQDVFVLAFCDKLAKYCSGRSNGLDDFIRHWNDTMSQETVIISKEKNSLELQTIHKSKGLEYDVVIIPFCDWFFVDNRHDVWFETPEKGSAVGIFPSGLKPLHEVDDKYEQMVEQEEYLQRVDNLNLLYVAFTRPKHCLSIVCKEPTVNENSKNGFPQSMNKLLYSYLQTGDIEKVPDKQADDLFMMVTRGAHTPKKKEEKSEEQTKNPFLTSFDLVDLDANCGFDFSNVSYALSKSAFDYFETVDEKIMNDKAQWGTLVHSVLSHIAAEQDLQKALSFADIEKADEVERVIRCMFKFVESRHWFDGTYKVIMEQSIVDNSYEEKQRVKRPDRIMIGGNGITVVDYKFMQNVEDTSRYEDQIREYGHRLMKMGYENINLYLWAVQSQMVQMEEHSETLKQKLVEVKL